MPVLKKSSSVTVISVVKTTMFDSGYGLPRYHVIQLHVTIQSVVIIGPVLGMIQSGQIGAVGVVDVIFARGGTSFH